MLNRKVFQDGVLIESTTVIEDPPGTFTYTRSDGGGNVIEQRDARTGEVEALAVRDARDSRLASERAVRDLTRASVTSSPGVQDAIMALRGLLLEIAVTSDD